MPGPLLCVFLGSVAITSWEHSKSLGLRALLDGGLWVVVMVMMQGLGGGMRGDGRYLMAVVKISLPL